MKCAPMSNPRSRQLRTKQEIYEDDDGCPDSSGLPEQDARGGSCHQVKSEQTDCNQFTTRLNARHEQTNWSDTLQLAVYLALIR